MKLVKSGMAWGPSPFNPFPFNSRLCPHGSARKHKYALPPDPRADLCRMTSDFSAGTPSSVNDLCWAPHFMYTYFAVEWLCALVVHYGPGTRVSLRDIPKCFKMNSGNPTLFFLHVSRFITREYGIEFFVDTADEFGQGSQSGSTARSWA
jgi:hypothetical protein